jgi:hypothetical protein
MLRPPTHSRCPTSSAGSGSTSGSAATASRPSASPWTRLTASGLPLRGPKSPSLVPVPTLLVPRGTALTAPVISLRIPILYCGPVIRSAPPAFSSPSRCPPTPQAAPRSPPLRSPAPRAGGSPCRPPRPPGRLPADPPLHPVLMKRPPSGQRGLLTASILPTQQASTPSLGRILLQLPSLRPRGPAAAPLTGVYRPPQASGHPYPRCLRDFPSLGWSGPRPLRSPSRPPTGMHGTLVFWPRRLLRRRYPSRRCSRPPTPRRMRGCTPSKLQLRPQAFPAPTFSRLRASSSLTYSNSTSTSNTSSGCRDRRPHRLQPLCCPLTSKRRSRTSSTPVCSNRCCFSSSSLCCHPPRPLPPVPRVIRPSRIPSTSSSSSSYTSNTAKRTQCPGPRAPPPLPHRMFPQCIRR